MPFKLGNLSGSKLYLGNTEIVSAFKGTEQVYSSGPPFFELGTLTYDNVEIELDGVFGSDFRFITGIDSNPDGTKLFLSKNSGNKVFVLNMTAEFDISTLSYSGENYTFPEPGVGFSGGKFADNGKKFYFVMNSFTLSEDRVYQYNLTTPYDLSTKSLAGSFGVGNQSNIPVEVQIEPSGTKIFVRGDRQPYSQYNLSTPFEASTASYSGFSFTPQNNSSIGRSNFSSDGTKLYITYNYTGFDVYTMSNPYDFSTISFAYNSAQPLPYYQQVALFNYDGTKMILLAGGDLYQYTHTF